MGKGVALLFSRRFRRNPSRIEWIRAGLVDLELDGSYDAGFMRMFEFYVGRTLAGGSL
jgi:hypothetical protein